MDNYGFTLLRALMNVRQNIQWCLTREKHDRFLCILNQTCLLSPETDPTSGCQNSGGESSKDQGMGDAEVVRGKYIMALHRKLSELIHMDGRSGGM